MAFQRPLLQTTERHSSIPQWKFLKTNGVRHVTAAPYHPSSNGLAERAVQTCKAALKKMSTGTLETKIPRFLLNYCTALQGTIGIPPA